MTDTETVGPPTDTDVEELNKELTEIGHQVVKRVQHDRNRGGCIVQLIGPNTRTVTDQVFAALIGDSEPAVVRFDHDNTSVREVKDIVHRAG